MTEETTPNRRNKQKTQTRAKHSRSSLVFRIFLAGSIFLTLLLFPQQITRESLITIQKTVKKTVHSVGETLKKINIVAQKNIVGKKKENSNKIGEASNKAKLQTLHLGRLQIKEQAPSVDQQNPEQRLDAFFAHLDSQRYIQEFSLQNSSKRHFAGIAQKLLNNPPVVMAETKELYTILKNTAHFFRILGKNNVLLLKGILHQEKEQFEDVLKNLYFLSQKQERLERNLNITFSRKALYDYATFFLDTMGGRLYLFRRDSSSRMVVTFYAIEILDQANSRHDSPNGTDIRPAIKALIEEMENGGNSLQFRDHYLDRLYQLQKKYQPQQDR